MEVVSGLDGRVTNGGVARYEQLESRHLAAIGIARAHDADLLAEAGADIVVTTLDDVDRSALAHGRLATKIA